MSYTKENTKKTRYSYKKGCKISKDSEGNKYLYQGSTFAHNKTHITHIKGIIDNEWDSTFTYYAETNEEFEIMNNLLDKEKDALFSQEMKYFVNHPLLINNNKKKEELQSLIMTQEYDSIKKEAINCLMNIDEEKYPTIKWILNNLINKIDNGKINKYYKYLLYEQTINYIDGMINWIVSTNHSIKNFIKIVHPKYSEFIIRNNYCGKSTPEDNDKNRKWRKNIETNRRRKERKNNRIIDKYTI